MSRRISGPYGADSTLTDDLSRLIVEDEDSGEGDKGEQPTFTRAEFMTGITYLFPIAPDTYRPAIVVAIPAPGLVDLQVLTNGDRDVQFLGQEAKRGLIWRWDVPEAILVPVGTPRPAQA